MSELSTNLLHTGDGQFAKRLSKSASVAETFPVYHTSVFSFDDISDIDAIYEGRESGYIYSRIAAPNADAVSEIIAAGEGAESALVFASGMAAITTAVLAYVGQGGHVVASNVLYGGVQDFFANELPRLGAEVSFVDMENDDAAKYLKPNTKLVYAETISNPLMGVPDIPALAKAAHSVGAKLLIDNTFATPVIAKPLNLGADVVLYSATKYLGGHSDIVGGAAAGNAEEIKRIRRFLVLYGGVLSPQDCWLLARSMRTLELRVRRHSENALSVARFLSAHPKVAQAHYPGLNSSQSHSRALSQFAPGLFGGMLSVDLKGGEAEALRFLNALKTITLVPSLAGTQTTLSWSAKTSHRFYKPEERLKAGILEAQLRLSVGLEAEQDIIAELKNALNAV